MFHLVVLKPGKTGPAVRRNLRACGGGMFAHIFQFLAQILKNEGAGLLVRGIWAVRAFFLPLE